MRRINGHKWFLWQITIKISKIFLGMSKYDFLQHFYISESIFSVNSVDPDQMPQNAESGLGPHF